VAGEILLAGLEMYNVEQQGGGADLLEPATGWWLPEIVILLFHSYVHFPFFYSLKILCWKKKQQMNLLGLHLSPSDMIH
jgi:hypothetical protein